MRLEKLSPKLSLVRNNWNKYQQGTCLSNQDEMETIYNEEFNSECELGFHAATEGTVTGRPRHLAKSLLTRL